MIKEFTQDIKPELKELVHNNLLNSCDIIIRDLERIIGQKPRVKIVTDGSEIEMNFEIPFSLKDSSLKIKVYQQIEVFNED